MKSFTFRRATAADADALWAIIEPTLATGDTWVFAPPQTEVDKLKLLEYWLHPDKYSYICECESEVVGTFFIKPNQPDLGNHIANAGYMTHPAKRQRGIGYAMGEYSLRMARKLGFEGMQFNFVVKSNEKALRLWQKLGFSIVGTLPQVFRHATLGKIDAYILFRTI